MNESLVSAVYLWENSMVMVFDEAGQQVSELEGVFSDALMRKILLRSNANTGWYGFGPSGPEVYRNTETR